MELAFVKLSNFSVPAVPRGWGLYMPVISVLEAKRLLLYTLPLLSRWASRYVVISAVKSVPGVKLRVKRLNSPASASASGLTASLYAKLLSAWATFSDPTKTPL